MTGGSVCLGALAFIYYCSCSNKTNFSSQYTNLNFHYPETNAKCFILIFWLYHYGVSSINRHFQPSTWLTAVFHGYLHVLWSQAILARLLNEVCSVRKFASMPIVLIGTISPSMPSTIIWGHPPWISRISHSHPSICVLQLLNRHHIITFITPLLRLLVILRGQFIVDVSD